MTAVDLQVEQQQQQQQHNAKKSFEAMGVMEEDTLKQSEEPSQTHQQRPQKLICSVQNYDWGRIGDESIVAKLSRENSGVEIDGGKCYAELWMGTHESGPSYLVSREKKSVRLKDWILENPSVLGDGVLEKFGKELPFLFKVLSVGKALSIQAHPDKELAEALHKANPNVYKDDNHKPEMALAVTEFEALCGFVNLQELKDAFHSVPEIAELIGEDNANQILQINEQNEGGKLKATLRSTFTRLMSASKDNVSDVVSKLRSRLTMENKVRQLTEKEQLVLRLDEQYPDDVGVISAFFLNYVKINPGEALFLGPNEPHSYIYGECIECMATSDNVVRAGFTPKLRDVPTLCSMLTYEQGFPEILRGTPLNSYTKRYSPPFDEFEVDSCFLPEGASTVLPAVSGPSIFIVTAGEGTMRTYSSNEEEVKMGSIIFVPADTRMNVDSKSDMQIYRAGVSSRVL